jgi:hypothetical protein
MGRMDEWWSVEVEVRGVVKLPSVASLEQE